MLAKKIKIPRTAMHTCAIAYRDMEVAPHSEAWFNVLLARPKSVDACFKVSVANGRLQKYVSVVINDIGGDLDYMTEFIRPCGQNQLEIGTLALSRRSPLTLI